MNINWQKSKKPFHTSAASAAQMGCQLKNAADDAWGMTKVWKEVF